jgi:hypothetical protein
MYNGARVTMIARARRGPHGRYVNGAADVHAELPHNTVRIFIAPPSRELRKRILSAPDIPLEELSSGWTVQPMR